MNPHVARVNAVVDALFSRTVHELQSLPKAELEDAYHAAKSESEQPQDAIHQVSAQFVYRCAEAVIQVRKEA
jgi:hypothetical protein